MRRQHVSQHHEYTSIPVRYFHFQFVGSARGRPTRADRPVQNVLHPAFFLSSETTVKVPSKVEYYAPDLSITAV